MFCSVLISLSEAEAEATQLLKVFRKRELRLRNASPFFLILFSHQMGRMADCCFSFNDLIHFSFWVGFYRWAYCFFLFSLGTVDILGLCYESLRRQKGQIKPILMLWFSFYTKSNQITELTTE